MPNSSSPKVKETIVVGFAIFASLFGAGNLILPPFLGFNAGPDWWLVGLGFFISAIIIPLMAVLAHAKLQGTMLDFGNKVSPLFSLVFCIAIYLIAISLPIPRTASVIHEMAIAPFFGTSSLVTSSVYFGLVFLCVMKRNAIIDILGKYLTPIIFIILIAIIGIGICYDADALGPSIYKTPLIDGVLEGYQTYDALGGLLIGGVIVISLNFKEYSADETRILIFNGGLIAAAGLVLIYGGLIGIGALYSTQFDSDITRPELLVGLSTKTLGNMGTLFLSVLVGLACFTTAVSVIVGAADFFQGLFKDSKKIYLLTAIVACLVGIGVGQFDVSYIIIIAIPALLLIYPMVIVLICLNLLPERFASNTVFRFVIFITFLFSVPDFLKFIIPIDSIQHIHSFLPLSQYSLGWLLPALTTFVLTNLIAKNPTGSLIK